MDLENFFGEISTFKIPIVIIREWNSKGNEAIFDLQGSMHHTAWKIRIREYITVVGEVKLGLQKLFKVWPNSWLIQPEKEIG